MHVFESINTQRYAKCIEVSKRVRWDIERDVIRGRDFDADHKFLPDGLSFADRIESLSADERRLLSQIQGRTYANMFGLCERFIGAKMVDITRDHALGDQTAFEALIRFTDEELKHQRLFRRIELLAAEQMPDGYRFLPQPNDRCRFRSWQVDLGRARADLPYRNFHAGALPAEHRARSAAIAAVQRRLLLSLERRIAARNHRRARMAA